MGGSILLFGFLIGMKHALEADHVAAVASLATRQRRPRDIVRAGAAWGLGHAATLAAVGTVVLLLDTVVPQRLAAGLEFAVGVMLVLLGGDVLRRLWRERVHFHLHRHSDGRVHLHAHSHAGQEGHEHHDHAHAAALPLRALVVGLVHGMAGSAALVLLTLTTVGSVAEGLAYMALFGVGSVAGMALLSASIALPLHYSARHLTRLHNGLMAVVGVGTVALGAVLVYDIGVAGTLFG